jgi:hypothetical protein
MNGLNPYLLIALIILALAATIQYYRGAKKNRWLSGTISKALEETLKPSNTNYINIGGAIGYNFSYAMRQPWTSAKGTFTMSPRQSLLYLPFSRLLGFRDRLFINLFTKGKLRGEGHIVSRAHLRKARIEGIEKMSRRETEAGGKRFVLLWRGADISSELEGLLAAFPNPRNLDHFCSFPETKTFFYRVVPKPEGLQGDLEILLSRLPVFFEKGKE